MAFHCGHNLKFPIKLNVLSKSTAVHFKKILQMKAKQVVCGNGIIVKDTWILQFGKQMKEMSTVILKQGVLPAITSLGAGGRQGWRGGQAPWRRKYLRLDREEGE